MNSDALKKLKALLLNHEGYRQFPYFDTTGHETVGIGRNLTTSGISIPEAYYLLSEDIHYFEVKLNESLKFFSELNENRQIALIDMCFNLGIHGFLAFKGMIIALEANDFERAAWEMLNSKWSSQVGDRAKVLADIVRTGEM